MDIFYNDIGKIDVSGLKSDVSTNTKNISTLNTKVSTIETRYNTNSSTSLTFATGFTVTFYLIHGSIVSANGSSQATGSIAKGKVIGTLPAAYRPNKAYLGMIINNGGTIIGTVTIKTDGTVTCNSDISAQYMRFQFIYPV